MTDIPRWELHLKEVSAKAAELRGKGGFTDWDAAVTAAAEVLAGSSQAYRDWAAKRIHMAFIKETKGRGSE